MQIVVAFQDRALSQFAQRLGALAANGPVVMAEALNAGGQAVRAATVAAETAQTGLTHDTIDRAQHAIAATPGNLAFTITSRGGNVRLKYFGAREGGGGVTAHPWNRPTFYRGAFINSGFGARRAPSPKLGGHVYERTGAISAKTKRPKIRQVRSGLFIPKEMQTGATAKAFTAAANTVLTTTIVSRLGSLMP